MSSERAARSLRESPRRAIGRLLAEHGRLPFDRVMEEALYGQGGYYRRDSLPIGPAGDFITGSSHSELFGRATARVLHRLGDQLERPADLLEAGCGDGRHLGAVAAAAPQGSALRGWDRVKRALPAGVKALSHLADLPAPIDGVVFSYELFDAMPVHRLIGLADGSVGELWVVRNDDDSLGWESGEISRPELAEILGSAGLEPGQVADLSPGWGPLYRRLARCLGRGLLVTCDYGYERSRLLDPRVRRHGTLAAYRRHRVHRDVLADLGAQDLTAHVDFTTLRETGEAEGLETVALTRQALWLAAAGIFEDLPPGETSAAALTRRQQAAVLLDPDGMGEEIRVLVQARGVDVERIFDSEILLAGG